MQGWAARLEQYPRTFAILTFVTGLAVWVGWFLHHPIDQVAAHNLLNYPKYFSVIALLGATVFVATALAAPVCERRIVPWLESISKRSMLLLMAALCVVECVLIFRFSNMQFGAFDMSVAVDVMWREASGQAAYRDYITTNPPLFILGLKLASKLFGIAWNAQAYLLCLFAVGTFMWNFWLLRRLGLNRASSMLLSVSAQVSGILLISFWWYNNTTSMAVVLFLLSCMGMLKEAKSMAMQASYICSFLLLSLAKPNAAGLTIVAGGLMLVAFSKSRLRIVLLSCFALLGGWLIFALNHMSVLAMLHEYRLIARYRGIANVGFAMSQFTAAEQKFQLICLATLLPLLVLRLVRRIRAAEREGIARYLLLVTGIVVGIFSMYTNGELTEVALPSVVIGVGIVAFEHGRVFRPLLIFFVALVVAMTSTEMVKSYTRLRVNIIGMYFRHVMVPIEAPFFASMKTGEQMNRLYNQARDAAQSVEKPVFLAPRLEWLYPVLRIPSPTNLPVFYQACTSYSPEETGTIAAAWEAHHFATVIQGRGDWELMSPEFIRRIEAEYDQDGSYPDIVIWKRKASGVVLPIEETKPSPTHPCH